MKKVSRSVWLVLGVAVCSILLWWALSRRNVLVPVGPRRPVRSAGEQALPVLTLVCGCGNLM